MQTECQFKLLFIHFYANADIETNRFSWKRNKNDKMFEKNGNETWQIIFLNFFYKNKIMITKHRKTNDFCSTFDK